MAMHRPQLFLLAYDIGDPRRLQQVHRTVREAGVPVQYSVFLIPASPVEIEALLSDLDTIIDPADDDIRVYPLPSRLEAHRYGRQHLPIGLDLVTGDHLREAFLGIVGAPETE